MNDTIQTTQTTHVSTTDTKNGISRFWHIGSLVVGGLFVLSVLFQVFLAGSGIFASSSWWPIHETLGMSIGLLPLAFLLLAWPGQLGARALWLSGLAVVLVIIQMFLVSSGVALLAALHPVNALVIFGLALWLTWRAWQSVRADRQVA